MGVTQRLTTTTQVAGGQADIHSQIKVSRVSHGYISRGSFLGVVFTAFSSLYSSA